MNIKLELTNEQTRHITKLIMDDERHTRKNSKVNTSIMNEIERGLAQMFIDNAESIKEDTGIDVSTLVEDDTVCPQCGAAVKPDNSLCPKCDEPLP